MEFLIIGFIIIGIIDIVIFFSLKKRIIEEACIRTESYLNDCCENCEAMERYSIQSDYCNNNDKCCIECLNKDICPCEYGCEDCPVDEEKKCNDCDANCETCTEYCCGCEQPKDETVAIKYKKLNNNLNTNAPFKGSESAAGFDLYGEYVNSEYDNFNNPNVCVPEDPSPIDVIIRPGACVVFGTNLVMEIPEGYYLDICPRSGLGIKEGLQVSNSPARIDSDYRGEILIGIRNISNSTKVIKLGSRIAQCTLHKLTSSEFILTEDDLSETERNDGRFGHSGI